MKMKRETRLLWQKRLFLPLLLLCAALLLCACENKQSAPVNAPAESTTAETTTEPTTEAPVAELLINEYATKNTQTFLSEDGEFVSWVELYNPTSAAVDLSGFGLTDELKKQYKYTFPEGTVLEGGAYLVLYCTGGTTATDADPYCTGFALSQEGETLYLVDSRYLEIDECRIPSIPTDFSYARTDEGTYRATKVVTPGAPNRFSD